MKTDRPPFSNFFCMARESLGSGKRTSPLSNTLFSISSAEMHRHPHQPANKSLLLLLSLTIEQEKDRRRKKANMHIITPFVASLLLATPALAGPAAYGVCQAGCATVVMACYSAAGFVWGATAGLGAPPAIIACNTAFGTCSTMCAALVLAPTP